MSPKALARAQFSLKEVDTQLTVLSNLLKYGQNGNRTRIFADADKWLDRRNILCPLQDQQETPSS